MADFNLFSRAIQGDTHRFESRKRFIELACRTKTKRRGSVSENYLINPDGAGGLAPFTVYCDMSDKNGVGVTVISLDSENRMSVQGCESPGCLYWRDIRYKGTSLSRLASLTRVPSQCDQLIKYECYGSSIIGNAPGGCHVTLLG